MAITGTTTLVWKFTTAPGAVTGSILLESVRWVGATNAGHTLEVTNTAGAAIFASEASGANFVDGWVWKRLWADGIIVTTMDSGILYLYRSPG